MLIFQPQLNKIILIKVNVNIMIIQMLNLIEKKVLLGGNIVYFRRVKNVLDTPALVYVL